MSSHNNKIFESEMDTMKNMPESMRWILNGVFSLYPLCIYMNLSTRKFKVYRNTGWWVRDPHSEGSTDDLEKNAYLTMPSDEWKEKFKMSFSVDSLLEQYNNGIRRVLLKHPQVTTEGIHWEETVALLLEPAEESDGVSVVAFSRYIDDEMAKTREIEAREKRYFAVVNSLSVDYTSIYYVDLETAELTPYNLSARMSDMFGEDFFNLDYVSAYKEYLEKAVLPDDKEMMEEYLSVDFLKKQVAQRKSFTRRYRNNENRYCEMKCVRVDSEDGGTMVVLGFAVKDEEIRAEQQAIEEKRRNSEIIEILASEYSSVYYVNLDTGEVVPYAMNETTRSHFGMVFTPSMPYSQGYDLYVERMVYAPDKVKMLKEGSVENIRKVLRKQKTYTTTYRSDNDGEPHFCEMKFVKVDGEKESPTRIAIAFADRDIEICNRYVNDKLQAEYTSVYLVDIERDTIRKVYAKAGHGKLATLRRNSYSQNILNYANNNVAPEYRDLWRNLSNIEYLRHYLSKQNSRENVYRVVNGEHAWRRNAMIVLERKNDIPVSMVLTFVAIDSARAKELELDAKIAQQKIELEEQHRMLELALQRAEAASIAKTTFLSNVSHDIRTPMNAILGFVGLARKHPENTELVTEYLDKAISSSNHLMNLINDVLDMSRIESGKLKLEVRANNLISIVHDIENVVQGQSESEDRVIEFSSDILHTDVYCDGLRLRQALINIIGNSIKFTKTNGHISFLIREIDAKEGYADYVVRIKDDGIGMSQEFVSRIFEPFERERSSTISGTQGAGLGMAITKEIVDLMDGHMSIDSKLSKGTEFTIYFKLKLCERAVTAESEPESETDILARDVFSGKHILVVEDNEINLEIISAILEEKGIIVDAAVNGREAVEKIKVANPDSYAMIFMDIQMPVMDGYEATRQIRAIDSPWVSSLPIVAMTANAFKEDRDRALEAGMEDHIAKPIDIDMLNRVLYKYLAV